MGNYEILSILKETETGQTLVAKDVRSGESVCIRKFFNESAAYREFECLCKLVHTCLPSPLEYWADGDSTYYAYSYRVGYAIGEHGGIPTVGMVDTVIAGISAALSVIHASSRVHYDVSPGNVLINEAMGWSGIGLIDVGHTGEPGLSLRGTPGYISPEVAGDGIGTYASDIYSAGIVLAEFALGQRVSRGQTIREIVQEHRDVLSETAKRIRAALGGKRTEIISSMIEPNSANRPSAMEVLGAVCELSPERTKGILSETTRCQIMTSFLNHGDLRLRSYRTAMELAGDLIEGKSNLPRYSGLFTETEHEVVLVRCSLIATASSRRSLRRPDRRQEIGSDEKGQDCDRETVASLLIGMQFDKTSAEYLADKVLDELSAKLFSLSLMLQRLVERGRIRWVKERWNVAGLTVEDISEGVRGEELAGTVRQLSLSALRAFTASLVAEESPYDAVRVAFAGVRRLTSQGDPSLCDKEIAAKIPKMGLISGAVRSAVLRGLSERDRRAAQLSVVREIETVDEVSLDAVLFHLVMSGGGSSDDACRALRALMRGGHTLAARGLLAEIDKRHMAPSAERIAVKIEEAFVYAQLSQWNAVERVLAEAVDSGGCSPAVNGIWGICQVELGREPPEEVNQFVETVVVVKCDTGLGVAAIARLLIPRLGGSEQHEPVRHPRGLIKVLRTLARERVVPNYQDGVLFQHILGCVGRSLWADGMRRTAAKIYLGSSRLARIWGLPVAELRQLSNFGAALLGEGDLGRAARVLEEVAPKRESIGDFVGAATSWGNAGIAYQKSKRSFKALASWTRQLRLIQDSTRPDMLGRVNNRIGTALYEVGKLDEAIRRFRDAAALAETHGDKRDLALASLNQSRVLMARGLVSRAQAVAMSSALTDCLEGDVDELTLALNGSIARLEVMLGQGEFGCLADPGALSSRAVAEEIVGRPMNEGDLAFITLTAAAEGDICPCEFAEDNWLSRVAGESIEVGSLLRLCVGKSSQTDSIARDIAALKRLTGEEQLLGIAAVTREIISLELQGTPARGRRAEELHAIALRLQEPGLLWKTALACSLKALRHGRHGQSLQYSATALSYLVGSIDERSLCSVPAGSRLFEVEVLLDAVCLRLGSVSRPLRYEEVRGDASARSSGLLSKVAIAVEGFSVLLSGGNGEGVPDGRGIEEILRVAQMLNASRNVDTLLERVAESLMNLCDAEGAYVVLLDELGVPSIEFGRGVATDGSNDLDGKVSKTIVHEVIKSSQSQLIRNALDDERFANSPSILDMSLKSAMCAPLVTRGEVLGAIYVENRSVEGVFTDSDLRLLDVFSNNVASAIVSAQLFTDLERSYEALETATERIVRAEKLKVLGELASGVAHDFNNLLTSILIRAQSLGLEDVGDNVRRELSLIEKAALDGAGVIRRIQDFTRVRKFSSFDRVGLRDAVLDAIEFTRGRWQSKLSTSDAPACDVVVLGFPRVHVMGNAAELREVFTNLILNAVDAMPEGGRVSIQAFTFEDSVRVVFSDFGLGVPVDLAEKIFDPFFTTKGDAGNGLGLSVAYGIISRHEGKIWVESDRSRGSDFYVELPLAVEVRPGESSTEAPSFSGIFRVLVVDDDALVRDGVAGYLMSIGCDVVVADSGEAALKIDLSSGFDLVLSDHRMLGMKGSALLAEIAGMECGATLALMTGSVNAAGRTRNPPPGVDVVIQKPFELSELKTLVNQCRERGAG